jgi:hypothetical protein
VQGSPILQGSPDYGETTHRGAIVVPRNLKETDEFPKSLPRREPAEVPVDTKHSETGKKESECVTSVMEKAID